MERPDWRTDPRYADRSDRYANASAFAAEIEQVLRTKTATYWETHLQAAGVPCARLRSLPEALISEQVQTRGFLHTLSDGTQVPTLPFRLGQNDAHHPDCDPPQIGQDNEDILRWLADETA